MHNGRVEDKILIIIFSLILICGLTCFTHLSRINYVENRYSYQIPSFSIKNFIDGSYQDSMEKYLSDQLPFSEKMKLFIKTVNLDLKIKYYHFLGSQNYHLLDDEIYLFEDKLVFAPTDFDYAKPYLEKNISNINNIKKDLKDKNFFLYYIEKDFDINFLNGEKQLFYNYISKLIDSSIKSDRLKINSFNDYSQLFYTTDHHWNYLGSYNGYLDIVNLLNLNNIIVPKETICFNNQFIGSKSSTLGSTMIYNEKLCGYIFDLPSHSIYVNNKLVNQYKKSIKDIQNSAIVKYADFYGYDYGLLEFNFNNPERDNLLIIGISFDNPIDELLASHFNKTYKVDLRNYEKDIGEKFNIIDFTEKNDINNILIIGDLGFFLDEEFNIVGDK